jgi:hypothetical protein
MSQQSAPIGSIGWIDLTVPDAEGTRDFYAAVVGWKHQPVPVGDYSDFNMMTPADQTAVAGICHARGTNADLPSVWLMYIVVADIDASVARCVELGGSVLVDPKNSGGGARYCIIKDPAGAVVALYQE